MSPDHIHRTEMKKMDDAIQRIKARRRKSTPDSLGPKHTFVDTLRDKLEWIHEEWMTRRGSKELSDLKWCHWAQDRIATIKVELEVYQSQ